MSSYKKVLIHTNIGQDLEEARLAAETLPGTLVAVTVDTAVGINALVATKNAVRGRNAYVVVEDTFFGKTVTDAIGADNRGKVAALPVGTRFTAIVKSNVAIAVNDLLVPDVDGLVDKATADEDGSDGTPLPSPALYMAMEACAQGATGDSRRIALRVIR